MAGHEEGSPNPLAVQNFHKLVCIRVARPVVEGQGYDALLSTRAPEDGAVEPRPGREPLVYHEPAGGQTNACSGQGRCGVERRPAAVRAPATATPPAAIAATPGQRWVRGCLTASP